VAPLLAASFEVLAREQPEAYARMCSRLEGLAVALRVEEEHFAATFSAHRAHVGALTGQEMAQVATRGSALLDILDARQTLAEAVLADAVEVVGPLDTLLRLQEGLLLYVQGAVRCPGFALLLRRLRNACAPGA
jgi:hypothetical protein